MSQPRYRQGVHLTIETTIPIDIHEVSKAMKDIGVTVLSCAVDTATKVKP